MAEPGEHLVLVGLMGSGKSTVGRRLAQRLGWPFVDVDAAIVERAGSSIPAIFAEAGEAGFRAQEVAVLASLLDDPRPSVLASGGGAVLDAGTRRRLRSAAAVWLRASPATLAARVGSSEDRPLLAGEDVEATLARLAAERDALYHEVAGIVVDVDGLDVDEVVDRITSSALVQALHGVAS